MNTLIICTVLLLLAINVNAQLPSISNSYLGAGDTGVDHYPLHKGLRLHIRCYANVSAANVKGPTALFDAGLPFFSTAWVSVIPGILANMQQWNFSRACFMDRYGYGWSDAAPYPFTTQEYVTRLHASLQVASITGPYVLVGWSWGSIFAQVFATKYPSKVRGMLTIDGTDSAWGFIQQNQHNVNLLTTQFLQYVSMKNAGTLDALAAQNAIPLGYGYFPEASTFSGFTQGSIDASQRIWLTRQYLRTAIQEFNIMVTSTMALNFTYAFQFTKTPLRDLPYVALYETESGQDWVDRQIFMSKLSSNSESISIDTDHYMPWSAVSNIHDALSRLALRIKTSPSNYFGC